MQYIVLSKFRDRRTGQVLPAGAPFFCADRYAASLLRSGMIAAVEPVPTAIAQTDAAKVVPPANFRNDGQPLDGADRGDTGERAKPGKRKPGRPSRAASDSDQR